jgi:hypothetical protein
MKIPRTLLILVLGVIIMIGLWGIIAARSQEDTWICSNGQWVAHGHPSAAAPNLPCNK